MGGWLGVATARHLTGPTCLGLGTGAGIHRKLRAAFLFILDCFMLQSAAGQEQEGSWEITGGFKAKLAAVPAWGEKVHFSLMLRQVILAARCALGFTGQLV